MDLDGIIKGFCKFKENIPETIRDILEENENVLLESQTEQLMEGRASTGEDLRPSYSQDTYFKSPQSAMKYANWKQKITPNPKRNADTPNLFITGRFHSEIWVYFTESSLEFRGRTSWANNIMAKYGKDNFGLTEERREKIGYDLIIPALQDSLLNIFDNG